MSQINRDLVLLSHANPEDNAATIWFATKLANEGYTVWSDATQLIGGENFWQDIEEAIRHKAAKVVLILSKHSNYRDGCEKELHVAQIVARNESIRDFVIPVKIDDLRHADTNIRVSHLNAIEGQSWGDGLEKLLAKLVKDGVPRDASRGLQSTNDWWQKRFATSFAVKPELDSYCSNTFPLVNQELILYKHDISRREIGPITPPQHLPWPYIEESGAIWTFAPPEVLGPLLETPLYVARTTSIPIRATGESSKEARDRAFRLLLIAMQNLLERRGLVVHALAGGKLCYTFPRGLLDGDVIAYMTADGRRARRAMVGYKMRVKAGGEKWTRHWHYGVQVIPTFWPDLGFNVRGHVQFSEDGKTLWTNVTRLQKARKNQCKTWWNDTWRDRLMATMSWLADGGTTIALDTGATGCVLINRESISFNSAVNYAPGPVGESAEDPQGIDDDAQTVEHDDLDLLDDDVEGEL